jgi:hypothetical protein
MFDFQTGEHLCHSLQVRLSNWFANIVRWMDSERWVILKLVRHIVRHLDVEWGLLTCQQSEHWCRHCFHGYLEKKLKFFENTFFSTTAQERDSPGSLIVDGNEW